MNINISNKVIVITGASRGIGMELCRAFAREGAQVAYSYLSNENDATKLYEDISLLNRNCFMFKADVTNMEDVLSFHTGILKKYGRIDVLINNAGKISDGSVREMEIEQWQNILDVNLTGTFLCSKVFSETMIKQKYGKIINIASLIGEIGGENQANYSAAKAGVIAFTKSLAIELGKYNISVNAICPGFIVTDLNRYDMGKKHTASAKSLLSIDNTLEDLVSFLVFFCSNKMKCISGRVFNLDSRVL